MNTITVKPTATTIKVVVRPQDAIQVRLSRLPSTLSTTTQKIYAQGQTALVTGGTGVKVLFATSGLANFTNVNEYNVLCRAYETANPTNTNVSLDGVNKELDGFTLTSAFDGVTVEWIVTRT